MVFAGPARIAPAPLLIGCCLTVTPNVTTADPVLVATYNVYIAPGVAPLTDPRVGFGLRLTQGYGVVNGPELSTPYLWSNGETGSVDFYRLDAPDFEEFAALATNGVANWHYMRHWWAEGPGGADGSSEIHVFHQYSGLPPEPPDLAGHHLELVRLLVNNIQITPLTAPTGESGFQLDAHLVYEFYGTPVPEATSGAWWLMIWAIGGHFKRRASPSVVVA